MIFFAVILLLCLIVFVAVSFLFLRVLNKQTGDINSDRIPIVQISIIVAAKNEAQNIERLLFSLARLDYPEDNFEVVIVDDQSTDDTNSLVKKFIKNIPNFRLISSDGKIYPAKKGALTVGINSAKFEFILTTDADCVVPIDWLKIAAAYFAEGSDIIFGLTPYLNNNNIVNRISSFERFRGQLLTFLFARLNLPYSAGGGNFGFKKSSFLKIKGYENTLQTLSGDDDLLINEAVKYKLKITPILNSSFFVRTNSLQTWKEYFKQRARHTSTSIYYRNEIQAALALWHLSNIIILFSSYLSIYNWIFLIPLITKIIIDIFIVKCISDKFNYSFNILKIIPLQILYELLLIIHFFNSFKKKEEWQ